MDNRQPLTTPQVFTWFIECPITKKVFLVSTETHRKGNENEHCGTLVGPGHTGSPEYPFRFLHFAASRSSTAPVTVFHSPVNRTTFH